MRIVTAQPSGDIATIGILASRSAVQARSSYAVHRTAVKPTATIFLSGCIATYISRAPTSTPQALGSSTGLSSNDIPLRFLALFATAFSFLSAVARSRSLDILLIGISPRFLRRLLPLSPA
jgi:hypothetical protein